MKNLSVFLVALLGLFLLASPGMAKKPQKLQTRQMVQKPQKRVKPYMWSVECPKGYDLIGDIGEMACLKMGESIEILKSLNIYENVNFFVRETSCIFIA